MSSQSIAPEVTPVSVKSMATNPIKVWFEWFYQRHGFAPSRIWVDERIYKETLSYLNWHGFTIPDWQLQVCGIPVEPR